MKCPKAPVLALALLMAMTGIASAQGTAPGQPVLDMHRLYQIVGYMYHIDPDLLAAIARVESHGDPSAVSPKGAQGLMQLMPGTAQQYRVDNPLDPVENVLGAARFLSYLRVWSATQAPYGEVNLPEVIAAYNAGPGAVEKYGGIPPYAETQDYVRKVLWTWLLGGPPSQLKAPARRMPSPERRSAAVSRRARRPVRVAAQPASDRSVFDQLAEIKRKRQRAEAHDTETRAALHIE
jgi:hypothetical protein